MFGRSHRPQFGLIHPWVLNRKNKKKRELEDTLEQIVFYPYYRSILNRPEHFRGNADLHSFIFLHHILSPPFLIESIVEREKRRED